jgi:hypothetical protein
MSTRDFLAPLAIFAFVLATPAAGADPVYKWVDDKGVVNYGNKPPAKTNGKDVAVVQDRVSVYTPEPGVVQATQNARERAALPPAPPVAVLPAPAPAAPPPVQMSAEPCLAGDVNCYGYPAGYAYGRRRPPVLHQPQLPAGAIAGNVTGGAGYIAGQSTMPPPQPNASNASRQPRASFTRPPDDSVGAGPSGSGGGSRSGGRGWR